MTESDIPMPAHNPQLKDRIIEMAVLVIDRKVLEHIPDGHAQITFEWQGGTRTWRIEGVLEPQSAFLDTKHNWQCHDEGLPQGQGEAILRFLEWVQSFTLDVE